MITPGHIILFLFFAVIVIGFAFFCVALTMVIREQVQEHRHAKRLSKRGIRRCWYQDCETGKREDWE